jgi:prevent-host-death family protein
MRQIQASEAKARFLQLLDDVEGGETVVVTRRGKPVATIHPAVRHDQERVNEAIARIYALRRRTKPVTAQELISARDEGRKR